MKVPALLLLSFSFVNVRITRCNASKLLFICKPSCRLCCDTPSVASAFSLPAKSTTCNFDTTVPLLLLLLPFIDLREELNEPSFSLPSITVNFNVTTLWDLELVSFAFVRSVDLFRVPSLIQAIKCSYERTFISIAPFNAVEPSWRSRISTTLFLFLLILKLLLLLLFLILLRLLNRSRIDSMYISIYVTHNVHCISPCSAALSSNCCK